MLQQFKYIKNTAWSYNQVVSWALDIRWWLLKNRQTEIPNIDNNSAWFGKTFTYRSDFAIYGSKIQRCFSLGSKTRIFPHDVSISHESGRAFIILTVTCRQHWRMTYIMSMYLPDYQPDAVSVNYLREQRPHLIAQ